MYDYSLASVAFETKHLRPKSVCAIIHKPFKIQ